MIGKQSLFCLLYNLLKYEKKFMHKTQISGYSRSTVYKKKRIKSFELCQNAKFLHYFPIIFFITGCGDWLDVYFDFLLFYVISKD